MDLERHLTVIKRHPRLIAAGVAVGVLFALLATFSVGPGGIDWRKPEQWQSSATLLVTQSGFPWGRTQLPGITDAGQGNTPQVTQQRSGGTDFADPARLASLAVVYAFFAESKQVSALVPDRPAGTEVTGESVSTRNGNGDPLPLFKVSATGDSKEGSESLNDRTIAALRAYISREQGLSRVPATQRVELQLLDGPTATMESGHGYLLAVACFLLAIAAAVAGAYLLENVRLGREGAFAGGGEPVDEDADEEQEAAAAAVGEPVPLPRPVEWHEPPQGRRRAGREAAGARRRSEDAHPPAD